MTAQQAARGRFKMWRLIEKVRKSKANRWKVSLLSTLPQGRGGHHSSWATWGILGGRSGGTEGAGEHVTRTVAVVSAGKEKLGRLGLTNSDKSHGLLATGTVPGCLAPDSGWWITARSVSSTQKRRLGGRLCIACHAVAAAEQQRRAWPAPHGHRHVRTAGLTSRQALCPHQQPWRLPWCPLPQPTRDVPSRLCLSKSSVLCRFCRNDMSTSVLDGALVRGQCRLLRAP